MPKAWTPKRIIQWLVAQERRPDFARATRSAFAFIVSFLVVWHSSHPMVAMFAGMTAQKIAMVDVKGDYRIRFCLLLLMMFVLVGSVALGNFAAHHDLPIVLGCTLVIALGIGLWRHINSEYGPNIAIISALLFLISLGSGSYGVEMKTSITASIIGGGIGLLFQVILWPWKAQHPLRLAVSDTWVAFANLFDAIAENMGATATSTTLPQSSPTSVKISEAEAALRASINSADQSISSASSKRGEISPKLTDLNLWAARLRLAAGAIHTTLETDPSDKAAEWKQQLASTLAPLFIGLGNLGRSIAVAVVSRQPAHVIICELRFKRLNTLLEAVEARSNALAEEFPESLHLNKLLREVERRLKGTQIALQSTVERRSERAAFPMELLELKTWQLRPLASTINLSLRIDPLLLRFVFRLALLMCIGVAAYWLLDFPHGYWLPIAIVVVLQPDFGTTRKRAIQRFAGTLAGSITASGIMWLHPPQALSFGIMVLCVFVFGYIVRRNFAVGTFFITIFVVLMMEASGQQPVDLSVTIERVGATLIGGLIAIIAAVIFWPSWESKRIPNIVAKALRANRQYLSTLLDQMAAGNISREDLARERQNAESANIASLASLRRLFGDPMNRREYLESAAILVNATQRLTRIANLFTIHFRTKPVAITPEQIEVGQKLLDALDVIITQVTRGLHPHKNHEKALRHQSRILDALELPPETSGDGWVSPSLGRAAAEIRAMIANLQQPSTLQ